MLGIESLGRGGYHFDGTNIKFRFAILDASGLVPQAGQQSGVTITAYDSARNADAIASTTVSNIGGGAYEANVVYSELYRTAGDGIWTFTFSHTNPDLTFKPPIIDILINSQIGTVTGTPTTTSVDVTGLTDQTANHYKYSLIKVVSGANAGEVKKITASSYSAGTTTLTVDAMSAALIANDVIKIINE